MTLFLKHLAGKCVALLTPNIQRFLKFNLASLGQCKTTRSLNQKILPSKMFSRNQLGFFREVEYIF